MTLIIDPKTFELLETIHEENKAKIIRIPAHPFNIEKANSWVDMQPDEYTLFCRLFLKYQIHVSGQEFLEAVSKLGNDIESRMVMGKYKGIIICSGMALNTTKSNFWVFLLLFPYIKKYLVSVTKNLISCYDFILSHNEKDRYLVLIPDDMAYSGKQISKIFRPAQFGNFLEQKHYQEAGAYYDDSYYDPLADSKNIDYLRTRYKSVCNNTDILIATPYLSTRGYNRIISQASLLAKELFSLPEFPIKFSDVSKHIIPLNELLQKDGVDVEIPEEYISEIDNCAIYFDHKLADALSSFPIIYDSAPVSNGHGKIVKRLGSLIKNCPVNTELEYIMLQWKGCPKGFYKDIKYTYSGRRITTKILAEYLRGTRV